MKLLKPNWVTHGDNPIYSLSIHPDGSRLATGGQGKDSGIVVIWNMNPIRSEDVEKDGSVPKMLCELTNHLGCVNCVKWSNDGKWLASCGDDAIVMLWNLRYKGLCATPAFGSDKPTHEQWGCGYMLRGHSRDVLDISWSHDDQYLASASVDNSIIIWNALKFPEQIATLTNHSGLVKGLTWDPVGKYLASQSDDKSVRVWRTSDWREESKVTHPFINCGGTTHVLRLSWSPDGRFLVSAHSLNNDGPTAHIIERNSWKTGMDFVGHRKAIEVVSFNPLMFTKDKNANHGCIAIGSRDRSVSVWLTCFKRPLVVVHDLFNNSVLDLAWSRDGYTLMACSLDGTCAYLSFTQAELGTELDKEAINDLFVDLYGTKRFSKGNTGDKSSNLLVEDPAMLVSNDHNSAIMKINSTDIRTVSTPSSKDALPTQQIETRTKDGRRRIKPITLTSEPGYVTLQSTPFSSPQIPKKKDTSTPPQNQSLLSAAMENIPDTSENLLKSPSQAKLISFAPLSPEPSKEKKGESKNQSLAAAKAILTGVKRPSLESGPEPAKQKRIKKTKPTENHPVPAALISLSSKMQSFNLPPPKPEDCFSTKVLYDNETSTIEVNNVPRCTVVCVRKDSVVWEVSFPTSALIVTANHYVTCVGFEDCAIVFMSTATGRQLFPRIALSSQPYFINVSSQFVSIATTDAALSVYDISSFTCKLCNISFSHLLNIDCDLKKISLTENGLPVVFTEKQVYCYNKAMQSWIEVINESEMPFIHSSKFAMSLTVTELTPLRTLQNSVALSVFSSKSIPSHNTTLTYLENQIARCVSLQSMLECQHWIKCYIRYLVSESMEDRLREFILLLSKDTNDSLQFTVSSYCTPTFLQECLTIITNNAKLQRLYCELRDSMNSIQQ